MNTQTIDPFERVKADAASFDARLDAIRANPLPGGGAWYPYGTIGNIWNLVPHSPVATAACSTASPVKRWPISAAPTAILDFSSKHAVPRLT
jgi:hypothetical protein